MKCPACGKATMRPTKRGLSYIYKGESTVIPSVSGEICKACGEIVVAAADADGVSAAMREFNRQVNATLVAPEFITAVRKKLALDQREAAKIFGGGVNAFSRYEKGKTKPPVALIKLLRVLEKPPELLNEIRK